MDAALAEPLTLPEQDRLIAATVRQERGRLLAFIRRRIADAAEADDILQETLYELVAAYRLTQPIEQAGAWLLRVARNRIIDRFRKKKPVPFADTGVVSEDGDVLLLEELLPSPDAGPEAAYARSVLLQELEDALAELPEEQREVFVGHEIEGYSFKQLAARTGVSVNTLLSRKHYAVLHLRQRLRAIYEEFVNTGGRS
jgi:RNA polymerase sigma factor (sigma-70 family)